ncbi:MAG: hypothetical protein LBT05_07640 [Planctomycetaceae bacterium]|jgi:hypothetical protein|nr:hypothetical protein [Planctomycetaceae bacterium]
MSNHSLFFTERPRLFKRLIQATSPIWLGILIAGAVAGITYASWQKMRPRALSSETYRFSPESIRITKRPAWVSDSIVPDVLSRMDINTQNTLIDTELLQKLAAAFQTHSWVESVDCVRASFPRMITVDLTYREALCMVQYPNKEGFMPIDKHGVSLPPDYFKSQNVSLDHYIKILGVESTPRGNYGELWGDDVVEGAAKIADHLNRDKTFLQIAAIRAENVGATRWNKRRIFSLFTIRGTKIVWGELPIAENDSRKDRLMQIARQYGSLDKAAQSEKNIIDLTKPGF